MCLLISPIRCTFLFFIIAVGHTVVGIFISDKVYVIIFFLL